jgi:murein DD-endopeptidase MepM/ murein hydrolase activator NlpD
MQAILAGISLIFLGWVAFTSVNVIFKDRIIATKERRYQQMQASYEARIADQQLNLDELNSAMITTADRFRAEADALEAKQRTLTALVTHKQQLRATLGLDPVRPRPATATTVVGSAPAPALPTATSDGATPSAVGGAPAAAPAPGPARPAASGSGDLPMLQSPVPAAPRTARPKRSTFLKGAVQKLADLFGPERAPKPTRAVEHPALTQIAQLEGRLSRLKGAQYVLLAQAQQDVSEEIAHFRNAIRVAGLDPNGLVARVSARGGVGGPLVPIPPEALTGVNDGAFDNHVTAVLAALEDLRSVVTAMRIIPMSAPVSGGFEQTSGFGARLDPFTRHFAFHAGLDWSGPWSAPIHATAPGVVVYAGWRGGYGNTVEVDHGHGFKTRYGHMRAVLVQVGQRVVKGSVIGRLGSSGRSTGPHIHYEVWFDNTVRDPSRFLRAGRYVLER